MQFKSLSLFRLAGFCTLAFFCTVAAAQDALLDRAKRLLAQKQAKEAYELLLPQEAARAGDPAYDYLLGIAANDLGEHERAVFALERVLAVQPTHHLARAEIARAYLAMGERDAARREFETVRAQQIPDDAKASIDRFLSAIRAADTTRIDGYVELGVAYDTNVNGATAASNISIPTAVPIIGGLTLDLNPLSREREDTAVLVAGGLSVTRRLTPEWSVIAGASGSARLHADESLFDQMFVDASLGGRWNRGGNAVTLAAQAQTFELGYDRFREVTGAVAQWQHTYDTGRQVSLFGQYSELRYPTQSIRNAERQVLGLAYGQALNLAYSPVLFVSGYVGQEDEEAAGVPHLGHDLWGARLGGQLRLGLGWGLFGSLGFEKREYGGTDPIFLVTREDEQTDLNFGVSYLVRPNTTLIGQLSYTDSSSNVPINDYDRTVASITLRFNF